MIPVRLSSNDVKWAMEVGNDRWLRAKKRKSKARFKGAKLEHHLMGAGGELAFCRALGLAWPASLDSYHDDNKPDVYPNWEVRTAPRMRGVKVVDTDSDSRLAVWVRGDRPDQNPTYEIMGYLRAGGVKRHLEWFKDRFEKDRAFWLAPERNMVPINPDFHDACGYARDEMGRWACAFCGAGIEGIAHAV